MNPKKQTIIDGMTIKYHANGQTIWSKGRVNNHQPEGYWEWYRVNGTIKRSGYFLDGHPIGEWITYDASGKPYKTTLKK
jgi:antitoxin component YwqK of YwqJK toxin-antitoxin module